MYVYLVNIITVLCTIIFIVINYESSYCYVLNITYIYMYTCYYICLLLIFNFARLAHVLTTSFLDDSGMASNQEDMVENATNIVGYRMVPPVLN